MKALIDIAMDSAAFDGNPRHELVRIIDTLAQHIANGGEGRSLYDANGNAVGAFRFMQAAAFEIADIPRAYSFDGRGINGNDPYRTRLATLTAEGRRQNIGPALAACPILMHFAQTAASGHASYGALQFLAHVVIAHAKGDAA